MRGRPVWAGNVKSDIMVARERAELIPRAILILSELADSNLIVIRDGSRNSKARRRGAGTESRLKRIPRRP